MQFSCLKFKKRAIQIFQSKKLSLIKVSQNAKFKKSFVAPILKNLAIDRDSSLTRRFLTVLSYV